MNYQKVIDTAAGLTLGVSCIAFAAGTLYLLYESVVGIAAGMPTSEMVVVAGAILWVLAFKASVHRIYGSTPDKEVRSGRVTTTSELTATVDNFDVDEKS